MICALAYQSQVFDWKVVQVGYELNSVVRQAEVGQSLRGGESTDLSDMIVYSANQQR